MLLPVAKADDGQAMNLRATELAEARSKLHKAPHLAALISETHPAVPDRVFLVESVVRVVGKGFGASQEGGKVGLRVASMGEPRALEVLSWRDDEVRVRLPRAVDLGIDPATAETLRSELNGERRFVALSGQLSLAREGRGAELEMPVQIVVVARDLDGDGKPRESDRDDLDPKVQ